MQKFDIIQPIMEFFLKKFFNQISKPLHLISVLDACAFSATLIRCGGKFIFLALAFILLPFFARAASAPLTGYAWSENAGWINFTDSSVAINNDAVVTTGELQGYVWGENIGWINFNCSNDNSCASVNFKVSADLSALGLPCASCPVCPACRSCPVCETVSCPFSGDATPPIVSEISVANISQKSATISWKTNELADSIVEYGLDTSYKFLTGNASDISTKVLNHAVDLKNLLFNTIYHFKIISRDSAGNIFLSADQTFKTLPSDEPDQPPNPDDLQLILPEVAVVENLTSFSASIFWKTDMEANSLVRVKLESAPESAWQEIGDTSNYATDHRVALTGLKADTSYQYQVKSSTSSGSTALSKIKTFKTKLAPVISEVLVSDITLDSAIISWKTNIASTSAMDYGFSADYGFYAGGNTKDFVTAHEIKLKNLKSGITYNFRVKGNDDSDNLIVSDNYSFKTYALPLIIDYSAEEIKDTSAVVKWTSNIDIDSFVIYNNLKTGESRTQGDTRLAQKHELKLENLDSGADYIVKIEGRDIFGNAAKGPEIKITTLLDIIAPEIKNVRTYATMTSDKNRTQLVVVWKTDEQATSQVFLFNVADASNPVYSSVFDSNLTTNHTIIIADLKPDTSYRLRIESKDKAGNSGLSQDFAVLTPREKKSIIALILEKFEEIFGWMKKINP